MTVDVSPLNVLAISAAAGAAGPTSFFDSFSRANGPLGPDWAYGAYGVQPPFTNPIQGPFPWIQMGSTRSCLNWTLNNAVGVGQQWITWMSPIPTMFSLRNNKTQFSQCTFDSAVASAVSGITVCMRADLGAGYLLETENIAGGATKLYAAAAGGGTPWVISFALLGTAKVTPLANGDIIRLSANLSVPGQVTLTCKVNGATTLTVVDAVANYHIGFPGMMSIGQFTDPGNHFWRDYSCGIGL
jgi:hypothetical protein